MLTKVGLIPAHAGKTIECIPINATNQAHPRSRGENTRLHRRGRAHWGSSPLTRGKLRRPCSAPAAGGLIPAHAGKTGASRRCALRRGAHPRSRGENMNARFTSRATCGSSPLTRGKLSLGMSDSVDKRLIPAHAGKTASAPHDAGEPPAHPRSRGENAEPDGLVDVDAGSSPLTRGKLGLNLTLTGCFRLIPAHAGKTSLHQPPVRVQTAHPRSRGENTTASIAASTLGGSSPLTRGKLARWKRAPRLQGLIPAHAGKTAKQMRVLTKAGAHPRSRGENGPRKDASRISPGSSPLTRGKRKHRV